VIKKQYCKEGFGMIFLRILEGFIGSRVGWDGPMGY